MSQGSAIQWTDATWNPTTGCTKVSPGCAHCYIESTPPMRMAGRKFVKGTIPLQFHENRLEAPLHWRKPRRIFVNSMSDLFHEDVPDGFVDKVFAVMALCSRHTFQVLTKRPARMRDYVLRLSKSITPLETYARSIGYTFKLDGDKNPISGRDIPLLAWPIRSVWLGVSCEDQARADERIPLLLQTPAAVRFLSCEPLLGPLEFSNVTKRSDAVDQLGKKALRGIHWVIIGGESGHGARPCDVAWIRSLVSQCKAAGVQAFVKQLGENVIDRDATVAHTVPIERCWADGVRQDGHRILLKDKKGGDTSDWPFDLRVREYPS